MAAHFQICLLLDTAIDHRINRAWHRQPHSRYCSLSIIPKAAVKILYAGELFAIIAVAISNMKSLFAATLLRLATRPSQQYAGVVYYRFRKPSHLALRSIFEYMHIALLSTSCGISRLQAAAG